MAEFPALNLYTDAFLADTPHLGALETGAYLSLLMASWRLEDGGLPDNDVMLARMSRCTPREWKRVGALVMPFWTMCQDGKWRQKRLEIERDIARGKSQSAARAAKAMWLKKNKSNIASAERTQSGTACEQDATTSTTTSTSNTHTQEPSPVPAQSVPVRPSLASLITDAFRPSDEDKQAIRKARPDLSESDLERRTLEFVNWHISKQNTSADWGRSWRNWMVKTREIGSAEPAAATDWDRVCSQFKRTGIWASYAGNRPGVPGCECPRDILAKHGLLEAA